jgi:geranylgeranyl diphosphate synthase type I
MRVVGTSGDVSGSAVNTVPGRTADDVLSHASDLHTDHYRRVVDEFPAQFRHIAGYHIGWWDVKGSVRCDTGKSVRPALVFACHRALRSDASGDHSIDTAAVAATAVELVHDFSLLHDDVMDRSRVRRHRTAAWVHFGIPKAVLTGDLMLSSAFSVLTSSDPVTGNRMWTALSHAVGQLCAGQALDMTFETESVVSLDDALQMVHGKTASLMACACELGAITADARPELSAQARAFGMHVGTAFQLVDDLLGIWGDPAVTGKPVGADLTARKKSLPVVAAMATDTRAARRLTEMYAAPAQDSGTDIEVLTGLVDEAGGRTWAENRVRQELDDAHRCVDAMASPSEHASELRSLIGFLAERAS